MTIVALILSVAFLVYSRRKMLKGYEVPQDQYDDLAPETRVRYEED